MDHASRDSTVAACRGIADCRVTGRHVRDGWEVEASEPKTDSGFRLVAPKITSDTLGDSDTRITRDIHPSVLPHVGNRPAAFSTGDASWHIRHKARSQAM